MGVWESGMSLLIPASSPTPHSPHGKGNTTVLTRMGDAVRQRRKVGALFLGPGDREPFEDLPVKFIFDGEMVVR